VYELAGGLQFVYGLSIGYWQLWHNYNNNNNDKNSHNEWQYNETFLGPFARLRWHFLELSYRGRISNSIKTYKSDGESDEGFSYNNQFMLGFNFATKNRLKPPKRKILWRVGGQGI
jgi:hypothetical protein